MIRSAAIQTSTAVARQGTRRARGLTPATSYANRCVTSSSSNATDALIGRRRRKPTDNHAASSSAASIENNDVTDHRPSLRMRRSLSSLSVQPQSESAGPGLLQSNALASQYLGTSTSSSTHHSSRADLLRHDPAHSEALTRLVRTLLSAPSAVIDSSLAVGVDGTVQQEETAIVQQNKAAMLDGQSEQVARCMNDSKQDHKEATTFVSDGWGELDQAPLRKEAASLAGDDTATDANANADTAKGDAPLRGLTNQLC